MKPQASQLTWKTDNGNVLLMEPHYLVRWSLRSSFEWKVKSQTSQLKWNIGFELFRFRNTLILLDEAVYNLSNEKWNHKQHN